MSENNNERTILKKILPLISDFLHSSVNINDLKNDLDKTLFNILDPLRTCAFETQFEVDVFYQYQ